MTYLVLARKWRPRSFDTLIGQDHVVRALTHALTTQRLHHAWLFTGTRGVGKTTLSRILAKSLNCLAGITASPCGVCQACTEIDAGRFVDYVELDAASNRGVDEMTQLLEQAVYAPSTGRFKVYMIDEVHMLTGHAFNAMLKTLEEPPPHVKFILATTDPQKIPVTVLSRCLQFNLKQMTAQAVVEHLQYVLEQEGIRFETAALRLIARAASGSMRDALSLTDQAIAYSAENLTAEAIQGMLGTIDQRYLVRLLQVLAAGSGLEVLHVADELAERGLSYSGALADLAVLLSRIAIEQRISGTVPEDDPLSQDIVRLAAALHPDLIQLFYSVAVHSRQELSLAPDEYAGFVMACLRMLALVPAPSGSEQGLPPESKVPAASEVVPDTQETAAAPAGIAAGHGDDFTGVGKHVSASDIPAWEDVTEHAIDSGSKAGLAIQSGIDAGAASEVPSAADTPDGSETDLSQSESVTIGPIKFESGINPDVARGMPPEVDDMPPPAFDDEADAFQPADLDDAMLDAQGREIEIPASAFAAERKKTKAPRLRDMTAKTWPTLAAQLPLTGLAAELARQSEWVGSQGEQINLRVAVRTLAESPGKSRLCTVLSEHFGLVVNVSVEFGATGDETAYAHQQSERAARQQEAVRAVNTDPFVQALIKEFDAHVVADSVQARSIDKTA